MYSAWAKLLTATTADANGTGWNHGLFLADLCFSRHIGDGSGFVGTTSPAGSQLG